MKKKKGHNVKSIHSFLPRNLKVYKRVDCNL